MAVQKNYFSVGIFLSCMACLLSCRHDKPIEPGIKTEHVIIVIVDGARYSETWGDDSHQYIPHLATDIAPNGVVSTGFRNNGPTYTTAGHTAITTGFYQEINNTGTELPANPSVFQYYLQQTGKDSTAAWIIASKDKLEILRNTSDPLWNNQFMPSGNCGINGGGIGSGYRHDSITLNESLTILEQHHPSLVLINFREPDFSGHQGIWANYVKGITDTDTYIFELWQFLQNDPVYANKTTLFVTNDHGRHLDTVSIGFPGHGDACEGCRQISFFALGPDFKKNSILSTPREQIDITATVAFMLEISMTGTEGDIMYELFQ